MNVDGAARAELLRRLESRHGLEVRGKILQRLLALSFARAGFRVAEERLSEGVDLDVIRRADQAERYSLEVRTTTGVLVPVKDEDLRGLDERGREGYATGFAVLSLGPGARWVFIRREWLAVGTMRVSMGTCPAWAGMAAEVNEAFAEVLAKMGEQAVAGGLGALAWELALAMRG